MTWQLSLTLTAVLAVSTGAVRSWLRSDEHLAAVRARRRRHETVPDPLVTLEVQVRLAEVARELRDVADDPGVYGRAHHWRAAQGAYDALLREACRLTGIPVVDSPLAADARVADDERLRAEVELSARGWSW